jgi:hypothetical protein
VVEVLSRSALARRCAGALARTKRTPMTKKPPPRTAADFLASLADDHEHVARMEAQAAAQAALETDRAIDVDTRFGDDLAARPDRKRGEMHALHGMILRLMPDCPLQLLDGRDERGRWASIRDIGWTPDHGLRRGAYPASPSTS